MPLPPKYQLVEVLSAPAIAQRVQELARQIDEYYRQQGVEEILLVGVLRGACVFFADLLRQLQTPVKIDFLQAASYEGEHSSGKLTITKDVGDIKGRHVLLIEDIIDTGFTMNLLLKRLQEREPASLRLCALLDNGKTRLSPVQIDFVGFSVPEKFLVGYGLDYNDYFRGLPYICELVLP